MTFKTYEINVDLVNDTSTTSTNRFSQNDRNSAKLLLTITNKGEEIDLSKAKSVRMSFKKPDGTRVFQNDCQPINAMKGKYQIVLKTQTLTSVGNVIAQIHIEEEDRILDTQKFLFVVNDSLASDEAIESTNEFTIIQKAIEAGTKLEGVDIDGIIAAGELAKGALPKAGGTMTGSLRLDKSPASGTNWRSISWDLDNAEAIRMGMNANNRFLLWDSVSNIIPIEYRPEDKSLRLGTGTGATVSISGETNLLRKSGDTITGEVVMNPQATFRYRMPSTASARGFRYQDETSQAFIAGLGYYRSSDADKGMCYMGWGDNPWAQANSLSVGENVFKYKGKDVAIRDKDGQVDMVVTADGEVIDGTNTPNVARRRGNTVSLRIALRRKVGSADSIVATIPADMRPASFVIDTAIATDGTPVRVTVEANGGVKLSVEGKGVYTNITYVVD